VTNAILATKAIMVILVCGCCPTRLCRWRSSSDDGWRKWRALGGLVGITGGLALSGYRSISAQAFATAESAFSLPGIIAHPPFSMNVSRSQAKLIFFNSVRDERQKKNGNLWLL
jgi:hypothetical protein